MRSMTGYGSCSVDSTGTDSGSTELDIQIKSVNGRFLDLRFHSPKEYLPFEAELKKRASRYFQRGSVDVFIHRRVHAKDSYMPVRLKPQQAKAWSRAIKELRSTLKLTDSPRMADFLALPHLWDVQERAQISNAEIKELYQAMDKALAACQKTRETEGAQLKKEIQRFLQKLAKIADRLQTWRERAQKRFQERLSDRMKEIKLESLDPHRLAVESALLLDKMDVQEELVRLKEHIKACQDLVSSDGAQGKKLDFYAQELLREVNTIGSKVQLAEMTAHVVDAKSIIEGFREQVQNIE